MTETLYKKVGRRYVPVAEFDPALYNSLPKGSHLITVQPGSTSCRHRVEPALAPMIAAGIYAEEAMTSAMVETSKLRLGREPYTREQQVAWQALAEAFDDRLATLNGPAAQDISAAGVTAMMTVANRMMKNDAVQQAYEHFLLLCQLSQQEDQGDQ